MEEQVYFYRDTWAEIDLDCITENVSSVKKHLPDQVEIIAVVKANAYGHGDVQVAKTALSAGASFLAVALMDEAVALRRKGIDAPILVLGATRPENVQVAAKYDIPLPFFKRSGFRRHKNICLLVIKFLCILKWIREWEDSASAAVKNYQP